MQKKDIFQICLTDTLETLVLALEKFDLIRWFFNLNTVAPFEFF